jgi:steroid delta-isomerase-like uncharacterized protein
MSGNGVSEAAKAVVRRNTDEVQSKGNFDLFEELFADDFLDHTPQPGGTPDKSGARKLSQALRAAFPDFHATIHWQTADVDVVTTFKTYHGTHKGAFLGIPATGKKIQFETVDAMRVQNGKITEHWGVAKAHDFPFPYLHDKTQTVARAYGAVCTPDFFSYNADCKLKYRGRLDEGRTTPPRAGAPRELVEAMRAIATTGVAPADQKASIGCSIKWKDE